MKREENMKYWKKKKKKIFKKFIKKFKQHSINIKNYTAHPHHLVHIPAKFRENTAMRFWVTVRKLNVTTVRNTLREIELQNDYCNGCGLTDHGCGMTLLSNELQIRTIGSIPGITGHNWLYHVWHHHNNLHGLSVITYLSHIVIYSLQNLLFGFRCHAVIIRNIYWLWRWKYISISLICNYKWVIMLNQCYFCL